MYSDSLKERATDEIRSPFFLCILSLVCRIPEAKIPADVLFPVQNPDGIQHTEDRDACISEYCEPHGGDSHET